MIQYDANDRIPIAALHGSLKELMNRLTDSATLKNL